ncbi:MAG: phage head closure protein [Rhodoblastus sp.]|nr:phage head closure protein [Rhodoblastus sp.]MCB9999821.1 phage head closure protein [Methylobacteriaceae bacterium]MCC0001524.1 phage head closure protein [Methylobacteriaceae bacterium]
MINLRSGAFDRVVTIERMTTTVDDYGAPQQAWVPVIAVHAQLIQATAKEFIRDFGAASVATCIFRIRYVAGITLADRVVYDGGDYHIKEVAEIGRRRGLELRCVLQP